MFSPINYALAKKHWSKAYGDLKILEIGSRNYLQKAFFQNTSSMTGDYEYTVDATNPVVFGIAITTFNVLFKAGTYTISYKGKIPLGETSVASMRLTESASLSGAYNTINYVGRDDLTSDWTNISFTFPLTSDSYLGLQLYNHDFSTAYNSRVMVKDIKVEQSNKATPWTPAPEDINADPFVAETAETSYLSEANEKRIKELENAVATLGGTT